MDYTEETENDHQPAKLTEYRGANAYLDVRRLENGTYPFSLTLWDAHQYNSRDEGTTYSYPITLITDTEVAPQIVDADTTLNHTWLIRNDMTITNNATLTLAPGGRFVVEGDYHIRVLSDGSIFTPIPQDGMQAEAVSYSGNPIDLEDFLIIEGDAQSTLPIVLRGIRFKGFHGSGESSHGGAIKVVDRDDVLIENCEFIDCSADVGGAVYLENSDAIVRNNLIRDCVAGEGGAVAVQGGSPALVNNLATGNQADYGGFAHVTDASATIAHNTISGHQGNVRGSVFHITGTGNLISGNILWDNPCDANGTPIYLGMNTNPTFSYNNVQGGLSSVEQGTGADTLSWVSNLDSDPLFAGDYHPYPYSLMGSSPCINAGVADTTGLSLSPFDFMGNARVATDAQTRIDIGCFEMPSYETSSEVSGIIDDYRVWGCDSIRVVGDIEITSSGSLVINPGVQVEFMGNYGITSGGSIHALGTETDSIRFISACPDSLSWKGISMSKPTDWQAVQGQFRHCDFRNSWVTADSTGLGGGVLVFRNGVDAEVSHSTFCNNGSDGQGGAIAFFYNDGTVEHSLFRNNQANHGGAVATFASAPRLIANLVHHNVADSCGGAYWFSASEPLILNNTIADNQAAYGGGIFYNNAGGHVVNSIITDNTDLVTDPDGQQVFVFYSDTDDEEGPPMPGFYYSCVENGSEGIPWLDELPDTLVTRSSGRKHRNAGTRGNPGKRLDNTGREDVFGGFFEHCVDELPGFLDSANGDYRLHHTSMCIDAGTPVGWNTWEIDPVNGSTIGYEPYMDVYDMGAMECVSYPELYEVSGTIVNNMVWRADTVSVVNNVSVQTSRLFIEPGTVVRFAQGTSLSVNSGSGLSAIGGTEADSIRFTATDPENPWAGIAINDAAVQLSHAVIEGVEHGSLNGTLRITRPLSVTDSYDVLIEDCSIRNNHLSKGGGLWIDSNATLGTFRIQNCRISNNTASLDGGGVYVSAFASGSMVGNRIDHNQTLNGDGGGVYLYPSIYWNNEQVGTEIRGNLIDHNIAYDPGTSNEPEDLGEGGGLYIASESSLTGNRVTRNEAERGDGICVEKGPVALINHTIFDNEDTGVYFYQTGSLIQKSYIVNSILWEQDQQIVFHPDCENYLRVQYCDVQDGGPFSLPVYLNCLDREPSFVDTLEAVPDLALSFGSQCIDTGSFYNLYIPDFDLHVNEEVLRYTPTAENYDMGFNESPYDSQVGMDPYAVDFGNVMINQDSVVTVTIKNRSAVDYLTIYSIETSTPFSWSEASSRSSGNNASTRGQALRKRRHGNQRAETRSSRTSRQKATHAWNTRTVSFPMTLVPGDSLRVDVQFLTDQPGSYRDSLKVMLTASGDLYQWMGLNGNAYDPCTYVKRDTTWTGDVYLDYSAYVQNGAVLTLSSNCTVHLNNNSSLYVDRSELQASNGSMIVGEVDNEESAIHLLDCSRDISLQEVTVTDCRILAKNTNLSLSSCILNDSYIEQNNKSLSIDDCDFESTHVNAYRTGLQGSNDDMISISETVFDFSDYTNLISISSYPNFRILDNTLENYQTAIWINESGSGQIHDIYDNTITNNQYGYGIELYHTYADVGGSNAVYLNYIGMAGVRNCVLKVEGNSTAPYQTFHNNLNKEFVFSFDSKSSVFEKNTIYDHLYSEDAPLIHCSHHDGDKELDFKNNFFDTNFDPETDLHPEGFYLYEPVWEPGDSVFYDYDPAQELFEAAEYNLELTNYLLAQDQYEQVINDFPGSDQAFYSAAQLLVVEDLLEENGYSDLQDYYLNEPNLHYTEELSALADYLANYCNIRIGDYPAAITWFEDVIADPPSEVDSLYAVIDLGYTYLLMEAEERDFTGRYPEYRPSSREAYFENREELITEILNHQSSGNSAVVPEYRLSLAQNYPNPFNPETTIAFSIPEDSHVRLDVYNIRGQRVRTLLRENLEKGFHKILWDGKNQNNHQVASGVYLYRLRSRSGTKVRRMILLK